MAEPIGVPEIESFNLSDLDVSGLDMRLELTTLVPACTLITCNGNCNGNHSTCTCHGKSQCTCHSKSCACNGFNIF